MDLIDKLTGRGTKSGTSLRDIASSDDEERILEALDASDVNTREDLQRRAGDLQTLLKTEQEEQSPMDPIEQLKKLNELRSHGALTEEEFAAQKKKLLGT